MLTSNPPRISSLTLALVFGPEWLVRHPHGRGQFLDSLTFQLRRCCWCCCSRPAHLDRQRNWATAPQIRFDSSSADRTRTLTVISRWRLTFTNRQSSSALSFPKLSFTAAA